MDKAKEAYNAYMRDYMAEYRQKNKDKVKTWHENYWKKKSKEDKGETKVE